MDYEGNSVISPRAFLLPQTEPLFEIKSVKNCDFSPIEDKKKRVFYGVRPCDIKALRLMEKFLSAGSLRISPIKKNSGIRYLSPLVVLKNVRRSHFVLRWIRAFGQRRV